MMGILADDLSNTEFSGGEALKLTLAGAAAGAVAYPIYKVLQPNYTLVGQSYPIGEGSYQLRVRRN